MKKGENLELTITDYAFEGRGISKISKDGDEKKYVVFVNGAYPGDKVVAQLRRIKKSYAEANRIEILEPSNDRVEPRCKYFGVCGGCKQQDLDYSVQLKYKQDQVKDVFERIGGFNDLSMEEIIPSDKIYYYRNKMEFSFAAKRWLSPEEIQNKDDIHDQYFALGLHIPRIFDKVLDIDECFLQSETSTKVLNFTRDFFKSRNVEPYSTKTHTGYLRNLAIRQAENTDDLMVNLVTSEERDELFQEFTDQLLEAVPEITTVVNNINLKKAQVAVGDYEKVFFGEGLIYDVIEDHKFRISANSFFQTNTAQGEKLYRTALEYADFNGDEVVYDLYCGAGTISIYVSDYVKKVTGFESVESAIEDANINKDLNGIDNTEFITADLNKSFTYLVNDKNLEKPDVIIADPPRSGMNPKTVRDILRLKPEKIVYVSCNPATQARDIKLLCEENEYQLVKLRPVDMFPHTYHIENVALLVKK
jgi:23S rRNA (uracil1939-C5)-methyltransferase